MYVVIAKKTKSKHLTVRKTSCFYYKTMTNLNYGFFMVELKT